MGYDTCKSECERKNMSMPCIMNSDDHSVFTQFAGGFGVDGAWIGYHDRTNEGVWEWESGCPSSYTNWGGGEPNDYGGGEDCMQITFEDGNWNDNKCNVRSRRTRAAGVNGRADASSGHTTRTCFTHCAPGETEAITEPQPGRTLL